MRSGWWYLSAALTATAGGFLLSSACVLDRSGTRAEPGATGLVGAGGAGAGGSGATTTFFGGNGGAPVELNCLDGLDDDGDGLVDCADALDCAGYSCVSAASTATAYVAVPAGADPCHPASVETTLKWCEGCGCTPTPGTCSITGEVYGDGSCSALLTTETGPGCVNTVGLPRWIKAWFTPDGNASCDTPSPQVPALSLRACSLAQAGSCSGGMACVPESFATAEQQCVLLPGRANCEDPYTQRRVVYTGASAECTCTCTPQGAQGCAAASIAISANTNNCSTQDSWVPVNNTCTSTGAMESADYPPGVGTISCNGASALSDGSSGNTLCCLP